MLQESIIDASEDSQLEAAIAASLKETSTEAPPNSLRDKEYLDTPDEDSLTEFTDSETESEKPPKDTLGNDSVKNDNRTKTVKWEKNDSKQKEKSVDDGTCLKKNETSQTKDVKRQDDDVDGKGSEGDDDDTLDPGELSQPACTFQLYCNNYMTTLVFVTIYITLKDVCPVIA